MPEGRSISPVDPVDLEPYSDIVAFSAEPGTQSHISGNTPKPEDDTSRDTLVYFYTYPNKTDTSGYIGGFSGTSWFAGNANSPFSEYTTDEAVIEAYKNDAFDFTSYITNWMNSEENKTTKIRFALYMEDSGASHCWGWY